MSPLTEELGGSCYFFLRRLGLPSSRLKLLGIVTSMCLTFQPDSPTAAPAVGRDLKAPLGLLTSSVMCNVALNSRVTCLIILLFLAGD